MFLLTPDNYQRGSVAPLVGEVSFAAADQFTGAVTQSKALLINTNLPNDPSGSGGGIVK